MYMHIYIYIYVCVCVYIYIYIFVSISVSATTRGLRLPPHRAGAGHEADEALPLQTNITTHKQDIQQ